MHVPTQQKAKEGKNTHAWLHTQTHPHPQSTKEQNEKKYRCMVTDTNASTSPLHKRTKKEKIDMHGQTQIHPHTNTYMQGTQHKCGPQKTDTHPWAHMQMTHHPNTSTKTLKTEKLATKIIKAEVQFTNLN